MNPISALIASTGLCSARAFLPAFLAALMLRLGADHQVLRDASANLIGHGAVATWFTSNPCLMILGVLAALELAAQRNHDARAILTEIDHYAKPAMGALTTYGLVSHHDAAFIEQISAPHQAGITTPVVALLAGAGTYAVALARNQVHQVLHDADSENATGIHGVIAWCEDAYAAFGMILIVLFPVLVAGLVGLAIGALLLLERRARAKEEAVRVPCASCGALLYRSALRCQSCKAPNPSPCRVNWLGAATTEPADPAAQPLALLRKRRCSSCAARFAARTPRQSCSACAAPAFADAAAVRAYDDALTARLPATLGLCALLGLVPVAGLIAGVLFYRVYLVAPYRAYVPMGRNVLIRIGLRLLFLILIVFQLVPAVGAITVPLMAFISYGVYRRAFVSLAGGVS